MPFLIKGALIEYGSDFLGPLKNVVIFQFNPETLSRDIQIPSRPSCSRKEKNQSCDTPVEKITLKAHFSAADQLNSGDEMAIQFGIGPRLSALEKMVYPPSSEMLRTAIDAVANAIGNTDNIAPERSIPRNQYPRILFIWGMARVLPVLIESMNITEQQYDTRLNPILAEVSLNLAVMSEGEPGDVIASGAIKYTNLMKDAQSIANLSSTAKQSIDLIPF
jgi:hypothetical protein